MLRIIAATLVLLLSAPGRALADDPPPTRSLTWGLRALDVALTVDATVSMYGVGAALLREQNPALRWAQHRPLLFGVTKGGLNLGLREAVRGRSSARVAWIVAGGFAGLATWNAWQISRARNDARR